MSDNDLIRRGDAIKLTGSDPRNEIARAIAALPAVTVTDPDDPTLEEIVVVLSGWIDRLIRERVDLRQKLAALEAALRVARVHVANNAEGWSVSRGAARNDLTIVDAALELVAAPDLKRIGTGLYETQPAPDYSLAPHLQRIVEASKTAPQWDTANDRMAAQTFGMGIVTGGNPLTTNPVDDSQTPDPVVNAPAEDEKAKGETDGQTLERLGMDGAKWAAEFRTTALRLGYSDMDEGWLIGWFANAIMAGYDRSPAPAEDEAAKNRHAYKVGVAVGKASAAPDPAAIREAALREAADLVNRIVDGVRVTVPCPDGKEGCLVHHFRMEDGPTAKAILALIPKGAADDRA